MSVGIKFWGQCKDPHIIEVAGDLWLVDRWKMRAIF
jgi:hypothetical protein